MADLFITEDFLLENRAAVRLYHEFARQMPILDYHCHLPAREIAEDRRFENLTQIWLAGDHYKWRAMRANGVPEHYITGPASDWEKFQKWAETVPKTLRNPLYHWTHMELKRPFGIGDRLLNPQTARGIWEHCNALLAQPEFSCRGIMRQMNVLLVCTTDDPVDDLRHHRAIAAEGSFPIRVLPTFRPDKAMAAESPEAWNAWVERLARAADLEVRDFQSYLEAIRRRHDFFHSVGCRVSDHGLEAMYAEDYTEAEIAGIFRKLRQGRPAAADEVAKFKSAMLYELAVMDHEKGWTQQYHLGALRNPNTRMLAALGPDTGFDAIGEAAIARPLARFLDRLDQAGRLAKTILYNLNPAQNDVLAALAGSFQDGTVPGKIQFGSAWWFLDQKDGIERQLQCLSNHGLLSRFVGMLTDSRSFLSYTRHEYFRRILCNVLGTEMEQGLLPGDIELIGRMVQDICFHNAAEYFGFELARQAEQASTG
ncbi:MAG: glucuronate isomerase [Thermoguttaceae bacterium]